MKYVRIVLRMYVCIFLCMCMLACAPAYRTVPIKHLPTSALGLRIEEKIDESDYFLKFSPFLTVSFLLERESQGKVFRYPPFKIECEDPLVLFVGDVPDSVRLLFKDGVIRFKPERK